MLADIVERAYLSVSPHHGEKVLPEQFKREVITSVRKLTGVAGKMPGC